MEYILDHRYTNRNQIVQAVLSSKLIYEYSLDKDETKQRETNSLDAENKINSSRVANGGHK